MGGPASPGQQQHQQQQQQQHAPQITDQSSQSKPGGYKGPAGGKQESAFKESGQKQGPEIGLNNSMPSLASDGSPTALPATAPPYTEEGMNSLMMAAYVMTEFGQGSGSESAKKYGHDRGNRGKSKAAESTDDEAVSSKKTKLAESEEQAEQGELETEVV
jgi:hypothetical protein